jgi:hypothetical protein
MTTTDAFPPSTRYTDQPDSNNLTIESRKAVGGLSCRHMLAGLAVLPA